MLQKEFKRFGQIVALLAAAASLLAIHPARAELAEGGVRHVLLLSIDGMHALDLANFIKSHTNSTLAQLSAMGVTYTEASAAKPSDSFPGLLAMVTGGSPNSTGVFYDDSYDRNLCPPGSGCSVVGTEVVFDESIDINSDALDAGGGIDVTKLPLDPRRGGAPVYPHNYLRVNTIFEVIKAAGGRTAWSDKHPAYEIVNGPSGLGVDDLYTPEIANSNNVAGGTFQAEAYDDLKVQAILNEIAGHDHTGALKVGVPAIFGMNFQAVSVTQKLSGNGYLDGSGTPSAGLLDAFEHTDQSLGKMVASISARGLLSSTAIIVSAKHGQSPIDPTKRQIVDHNLIPGIVNGVQSNLLAQATQDTIALIWLTDQSRTADVVQALAANQSGAGIERIFAGKSLELRFNDPARDSRVPDIIVQPYLGVIYAGATATKIAEHGGFNEDDTHVMLLVANPRWRPTVIKTPVQTMQIAPTILRLLGLNPEWLQAVRLEKTRVLPGLPGFGQNEQ